MNNDLISRSALKKEMLFYLNQEITKYKTMRRALGNVGRVALECVEEAPAVDAEVVRHGRWIKKVESYHDSHTGEYWDEEYCSCPFCGKDSDLEHNYCPNCGAKMDGE